MTSQGIIVVICVEHLGTEISMEMSSAIGKVLLEKIG